MKKTTLIAILCCALLVVLVVLLSNFGGRRTDQATTPETTSQSSQSIGIQVGNIAPDFSFQTIEGKTVSLSSLRGEPVIFTFALTVGCTPCQITAANIREAQKQASFKVIILAVNPRDTTTDLKNFRNDLGSPDWLIGFDKDTSIANLYNVRAIDTKFIVDAKGRIIYRDSGAPMETQTLIDKIKTQ